MNHAGTAANPAWNTQRPWLSVLALPAVDGDLRCPAPHVRLPSLERRRSVSDLVSGVPGGRDGDDAAVIPRLLGPARGRAVVRR